MRKNTATSSDRSPPPASQTRPRLANTRPVPIDEPLRDFDVAVDALRLAEEYDALRIAVEQRREEWERELGTMEAKVIAAMKAAGKTNIATHHGRVTLVSASEAKRVDDNDAAKELLVKHGIPFPPTIKETLARNGIAMPTKIKEGQPDRLRFEMNK